jgi:hypothetical protein
VYIPGNLSAARYWNEVLTPHMLLAMNLHREVLQHDNACSFIFSVIWFDCLVFTVIWFDWFIFQEEICKLLRFEKY